MKKILFALFAVMALVLTSCKDKVEPVDPGTPTNPEKTLAGTYTGTWTRTLDGVTETGQGTIVIAPTDERYICTVTISCPSLDDSARPAINITGTDVANITPARTVFNAFGDAEKIAGVFSGKISEANELTMQFTRSIKEGRKTFTYSYTFEGVK